MRTTNDNPVDPLGTLGPAVKPATPPAPDPVKAFEHINDQTTAIQTVADTLRKKQAAAPADPVVTGWGFGFDLTAAMCVAGFSNFSED